MSQNPNSSFGFDMDEILQVNQNSSFKRVKPNDIRKDLDHYFEHGKPMGEPCGIDVLDPIFRWRRKGGLYVISGYEQHGKSEFCKYLTILRTQRHKKKVVLFMPEEETEDITEDLCRAYLGQNVNPLYKNKCSRDDWNRALDFIEERFMILEFDGMPDFRMLTDEYAALAEEGYSTFVTDPWNYIAEGSLDQGGIMYLKTALTHMKTFSRRHKADNIIVEHQNNRIDHKGNLVRASKNNIQGGSMWKHKPDCIIIIHSNWTEESQDSSVQISVQKNKNQRYNGQQGTRTLYFDIATGRYLGTQPEIQHSIKFNMPTEEDWRDKPFIDGGKEEEDDQPF